MLHIHKHTHSLIFLRSKNGVSNHIYTHSITLFSVLVYTFQQVILSVVDVTSRKTQHPGMMVSGVVKKNHTCPIKLWYHWNTAGAKIWLWLVCCHVHMNVCLHVQHVNANTHTSSCWIKSCWQKQTLTWTFVQISCDPKRQILITKLQLVFQLWISEPYSMFLL